MRKSTKALCVWDSGSVIVLVMDRQMHTQAGTQCPGSTWKKYHPHRLKKSKFSFFSFFLILRCLVDSECELNDRSIEKGLESQF